MAKVFLDTNAFIDTIGKRHPIEVDAILTHTLFVSPLSIHIYLYIYKDKMTQIQTSPGWEFLSFVEFSEEIMRAAITGPTSDFEDNVQLHSAVEAECDFFLTKDEKLVTLGYFGKTQIVYEIPPKP